MEQRFLLSSADLLFLAYRGLLVYCLHFLTGHPFSLHFFAHVKLTTSMYTVRLRSAVLLLGMVFNGGRLALNEPGARIALRTASAPVTCDVATTAAPPTTPIPASPFTVR